MKKLAYLSLVLLAFTFTACGGGVKGKLVGKWQVETQDGKEASERMKSATITFEKDGAFSQALSGQTRKGKWELSKDSKSIILKPEEGSEETLTIDKVEKDKMEFTTDGKKYGLKKI
jgi:Lipocalin-like domain (DUF4923)